MSSVALAAVFLVALALAVGAVFLAQPVEISAPTDVYSAFDSVLRRAESVAQVAAQWDAGTAEAMCSAEMERAREELAAVGLGLTYSVSASDAAGGSVVSISFNVTEGSSWLATTVVAAPRSMDRSPCSSLRTRARRSGGSGRSSSP